MNLARFVVNKMESKNYTKHKIMYKAFIFVFCFICFAFNCFAYDIEPYPGKPDLSSQGILNLVFCSLHYQDKEVFLRDIDTLITRLKRAKPFDEFAGKIRFYYVVLSKKEENLIFKQAEGFPPLKARQNFLDNILAYLKSNYKLIIMDASGGVFTAELSSRDKLSLLILGRARYKNSQSFAKGFLHELGHSLGLRDEGLNSEAALCLPGPPNCAVSKEEAEKWWGDLAVENARAGYISGCCGNKNYIRPTIASLLNNPEKADDFGPVNERYLRKVLGGL